MKQTLSDALNRNVNKRKTKSNHTCACMLVANINTVAYFNGSQFWVEGKGKKEDARNSRVNNCALCSITSNKLPQLFHFTFVLTRLLLPSLLCFLRKATPGTSIETKQSKQKCIVRAKFHETAAATTHATICVRCNEQHSTLMHKYHVLQ